MRPYSLTAPLLGLLLLGSAAPCRGQSLDPRFFVNTPVGMNFILAGYGYTWGSVLFDPSVPIKDAHLTSHGPLLGYGRAFNFWGLSGKANLGNALQCAEGNGVVQGVSETRNVCGLSDLAAGIAVNFIGAPALSLPEFAHYRQGFLMGASLNMTAPIGQYDADRLLNIGTHRWSFRPQIGVSQTFGRLILEFLGGVTFYTRNGDFFGGHVRDQAPLYSGQVNVIYTFRSGIWGALGGTLYGGGRITTDGVESPDFEENYRLGLTMVFPVGRKNAIRAFGSTGLYARTGGDFNLVGVTWMHLWGGRRKPLKAPAAAPT